MGDLTGAVSELGTFVAEIEAAETVVAVAVETAVETVAVAVAAAVVVEIGAVETGIVVVDTAVVELLVAGTVAAVVVAETAVAVEVRTSAAAAAAAAAAGVARTCSVVACTVAAWRAEAPAQLADLVCRAARREFGRRSTGSCSRLVAATEKPVDALAAPQLPRGGMASVAASSAVACIAAVA